MSAIKEHYHNNIEAATRPKEYPVLFNDEMVRAILANRKTQTRRVFKKIPYIFKSIELAARHIRSTGNFKLCPYGKPGDLLYVRETTAFTPGKFQVYDTISYRADNFHKDVPREGVDIPWKEKLCTKGWYDEDLSKEVKWKPNIHMPKAVARIWLEITEVGVERVQDISEEDIKAEGVRIPVKTKGSNVVLFRLGEENTALKFLPKLKTNKKYNQNQLLHAFWAELWCSVSGRESWDTNPWVWVVKFKVVSVAGKDNIQ